MKNDNKEVWFSHGNYDWSFDHFEDGYVSVVSGFHAFVCMKN